MDLIQQIIALINQIVAIITGFLNPINFLNSDWGGRG
jgi:hypothetical protein